MYRYNESFVFCSLAAFMQVSYQSTEFASDFSKPVLSPLFSLSRDIPGKGEIVVNQVFSFRILALRESAFGI